MQKMSDVAEIIMGQSPPSSAYNTEGRGLPFFQGKAEFGQLYPAVKKWCNKPTKIAEQNDVLISVRAPVGPTNLCSEKSCIGRGLGAIRAKDKVSHYLFILYFLRSIEQSLAAKGKGSTFTAINRDDLERIKFPDISFADQKKIATILQKTESALEKRREAIRLLDDFLKSTFLEMFGDPISNSKKWPEEPLGTILDVRDGTHDTPKYFERGIPLVTSKNLKDGGIDFTDVNYISAEDHKEICRRSFVENGDILYGMIGTIGSPVIVNSEREFSIKNVALLKFKRRDLSNQYVQFLLRNDLLTKKLLLRQRGGNQSFVSLNILRSFLIPIPPQSLQEKFKEVSEHIWGLKQKMKSSETELQNLFNCLMQKAFKGEL